MANGARMTRMDYEAIAAFRFELRRFMAFSESAASSAGLPPQQHQALLAIAAHPGPGRPCVGFVAEQLLIAPHTAAELVTRMVQAELIEKSSAPDDRRRVELSLTRQADVLLRRLTQAHLDELRIRKPALIKALDALPVR